jgi:hypothetical protein
MLNLNYNIILTNGPGLQYAGINYISSGSTINNGGTVFTIARNFIETSEGTQILAQNTMTSSISEGIIVDYFDEFQATASISGSYNWPNSASFQALTMSLSIPEIGFFITSSNTASIISASFGNNNSFFRDPYTITASVELEPYPSYSLTEYVFVGAGGNGAGTTSGNISGGGGGAGAIISGSGLWIYPNSIYTVTVSSSAATFASASIEYIKAAKGGDGGAASVGGNGGNGGGGSGFAGGVATGSIIPTGSAIANISSSLGIFVTASIIGGYSGGTGCIVISGPTPPQNTFYNPAGGGGAGGVGTDASCVYQGTQPAGGPGVSGISYLTGSICSGGNGAISPAGLGGTSEGVNGTNATTIGSGGGGAKGATTPPTQMSGGAGASGIAIIRYLGPQKGKGGVVTIDGDYVIHTFYQDGLFYSTGNMTPKKH